MTLEDNPNQPTITVTTGPAAGRSARIDGELVIGREGVDLTISDDAELSRRHAVLRATQAGVVIEDLGSLNGTFVNDQRISVATTLSPDDRIRVGLSRLKLILPSPVAPDPTPIVDIEATRQSPVPDVPDATPLVDVETTRQRPVPGTPDATPLVDVETTRQRRVSGAPDPTPLVDVETTRQRPVPGTPDPTPLVDVETTRQRPVPRAPDATPLIDVETTRQRPTPAGVGSEGTVVRQAPAVQSERTTVRPVSTEGGDGPPTGVDAAPAEGDSPPPPGGPRGLPASVVAIVAVVAILAAIGIALASNLTSSKSTHALSATIAATRTTAPQQGQVELTGSQKGGLLGAGAVTIDEFFSTPGPAGAASTLLSARIVATLPAGTLVSVVKAGVTPRSGGGQTIAGTATITGGTSRYKHATGSYTVTGTQAAAGGATILTLHGSISY